MCIRDRAVVVAVGAGEVGVQVGGRGGGHRHVRHQVGEDVVHAGAVPVQFGVGQAFLRFQWSAKGQRTTSVRVVRAAIG